MTCGVLSFAAGSACATHPPGAHIICHGDHSYPPYYPQVVAMHTAHAAGACVEFLPKFSPAAVWQALQVRALWDFFNCVLCKTEADANPLTGRPSSNRMLLLSSRECCLQTRDPAIEQTRPGRVDGHRLGFRPQSMLEPLAAISKPSDSSDLDYDWTLSLGCDSFPQKLPISRRPGPSFSVSARAEANGSRVAVYGSPHHVQLPTAAPREPAA